MVRINFQPYTTPQLEKIVQARLLTASTAQNKENNQSPPPTVIAPDGIKFAAMKVSSVSGDARRVLDICRRAVELVQPLQRAARTEDVKTVIKAMQSSPTAMWLRGVSLHERVMLASVLKCVRREGVDEVKWGEVQHQHMLYTNILADDSTRRPSPIELRRILDSLLASHAVLLEDGGSVSRKPEGERRVMLNIEQSEVERVLGEIGGQRWKSALGV
jgi:origin recognition complex subunit 1